MRLPYTLTCKCEIVTAYLWYCNFHASISSPLLNARRGFNFGHKASAYAIALSQTLRSRLILSRSTKLNKKCSSKEELVADAIESLREEFVLRRSNSTQVCTIIVNYQDDCYVQASFSFCFSGLFFRQTPT